MTGHERECRLAPGHPVRGQAAYLRAATELSQWCSAPRGSGARGRPDDRARAADSTTGRLA